MHEDMCWLDEELPDYEVCPKCNGVDACDCDYCGGKGRVEV